MKNTLHECSAKKVFFFKKSQKNFRGKWFFHFSSKVFRLDLNRISGVHLIGREKKEIKGNNYLAGHL